MSNPIKRWMFAYRKTGHKGQVWYSHFGELYYVKLCYLNDPIVELEVEEIPEPTDDCYWGWEAANEDKWSMIWQGEELFSMCFPYGYKVEVENGKGRVVYLKVKEIREYVE